VAQSHSQLRLSVTRTRPPPVSFPPTRHTTLRRRALAELPRVASEADVDPVTLHNSAVLVDAAVPNPSSAFR
jgi:hypothetical protein